MEKKTYTCRICGQTHLVASFLVEETKQQTGDKFEYFMCPDCGCLQIAEIPENMGVYYKNYSPLSKNNIHEGIIASWFRKKMFANMVLNHRNLVKVLIDVKTKWSSSEWIPIEWVIPKMAKFNSKILDVGCGGGELVKKLAQSGFTNVMGIDPYISQDMSYQYKQTKVDIKKQSLDDITAQFDLIMMHHVLEHLEDQHLTFKNLTRLMHKDSILLLSLPIIESEIWDEYALNCFQLRDAPRHFFLHSKKSLASLFQKYNLEIITARHSAAPFVLLESERVLRGECHNPRFSFTKQEKIHFKRKAKRLQQEGQSGIVYYYLRLKSPC